MPDKELKELRKMITYAELLRQHRVTCSCCRESTQPGGSLVYTGATAKGSVVEWILRSDCEKVCDQLMNRAGQVDCGFDVCNENPKETRAAADEWDRWRRGGAVGSGSIGRGTRRRREFAG